MKYNLNDNFNMHYWDFLYANEKDLKTISRYIEFSDENLNTYSIELVRLYLSTCSEIEVVLKELCKFFEEDSKPKNIVDYRQIIKPKIPKIMDEWVNINFRRWANPWESWHTDKTPTWWQDYQLVKHNRNEYYHLATLDNVIHSVSALFICVHYYYLNYISILFNEKLASELELKDLTTIFNSGHNFLKLDAKNYQGFLRTN